MVEKKFRGAPFGTQKARFDVVGIHPRSKIPGTFTEFPYCSKAVSQSCNCGPGTYSVDNGDFSKKAIREKASCPGWAEQQQAELFASTPHHLCKDQLMMKQMHKAKLGPNTYKIKDFLELSKEKPQSKKGVCDTREIRFKNGFTKSLPGPGSYDIPHVLSEASKSFGTTGFIDVRTPRTGIKIPPYPGPGSYDIKNGIDDTLNKVVSQKGPYSLFSLDRNKPIIAGHFAVLKSNNLGPGHYDVKSQLEDWTSPHKKRHGKFSKLKRSTGLLTGEVTNSSKQVDSCPASNLSKNATVPQNFPPFSSSSLRFDKKYQRFFMHNYNTLGPGQYDVQRWDASQQRNGHQSVFKSTSGISLEQDKFLKERLQPRNTRPETKSHTSSAVGGSLYFTGQRAITMV